MKTSLEDAIEYFNTDIGEFRMKPEKCYQDHADKLETLIHAASLREPLGNEGWRPIESAPRDGTHLLLWWPHWYHAPITGYFCDKKEFRWVSRYDLNTQHEYTPTHWMPLPQPPKGER